MVDEYHRTIDQGQIPEPEDQIIEQEDQIIEQEDQIIEQEDQIIEQEDQIIKQNTNPNHTRVRSVTAPLHEFSPIPSSPELPTVPFNQSLDPSIEDPAHGPNTIKDIDVDQDTVYPWSNELDINDDIHVSDPSEDEDESITTTTESGPELSESDDEVDSHAYVSTTGQDGRRVARTIFDLMTSPTLGCTAAQHDQAMATHLASGGDNHHPLQATYNTTGIEDDPDEATPIYRPEVGIDSPGLPLNRGFPRQRYGDETHMRALFEGSSDAHQPIPRICLHTESTDELSTRESFDIDGFIGFPQTLGALRKGFRWCPAQHQTLYIRKRLHVRRRVEFQDEDGQTIRRTAQLRDIPHLYLGSIDGLFQCTLFVFFPRLTSKKKFYALDALTVKKYIDHVILPACRQFIEPEHLQRIPPSHEVAELKARARGVEQQHIRGERGLKTYASYAIQSRGLTDTWNAMVEKCHTDVDEGLSDFRDAFLVANAKNIKSDFKVIGSLYQCISKYRRQLQESFDFNLMDAMYHDLAREWLPLTRKGELTYPCPVEEPTCYLWKTCCLESIYGRLAGELFHGRQGEKSIYHAGFLHDTASMTVVPPRRSPAQFGGVLYLQIYAVVKDIADAHAVYPLSREDMMELAIDPRIWAARVKRHKRGGGLQRREFLCRSYAGGKHRIRQSYREYDEESFPTRLEVRIDDDCLVNVESMACVAEAGSRATTHGMSESVPTSLWAIPTRSWTRFMLGNYHKFTTALEIAAITSPSVGISLERSKVMATLIKCIQRFASCEPARDAILSYRVEEVARGTVYGLGFREGLPSYGYGWFAPVVNWECFTFQAELSSQMVRVDRRLHTWYAGSGRVMQDSHAMLEVCLGLLGDRHSGSYVRAESMTLSIHVCLREYRRNVLAVLQKELADPSEDPEVMDAVVFCHDHLIKAVLQPPHLMCGNKSKFAAPEQLTEWIWGDSPEFNRRHFQHKPFRLMLQKVQGTLRGVGAEVYREWFAGLSSEFLGHHWVIPYPDVNGTLISTVKKGGARQWWSGWRGKGSSGWSWGRRRFMVGYPPGYPATLKMDEGEFRRHLAKGG